MNYIENSDVLDQENCELVAADSEEIPEDSSKENGLKSSKEEWWRIIEGIKEYDRRCRKDCQRYGLFLSK